MKTITLFTMNVLHNLIKTHKYTLWHSTFLLKTQKWKQSPYLPSMCFIIFSKYINSTQHGILPSFSKHISTQHRTLSCILMEKGVANADLSLNINGTSGTETARHLFLPIITVPQYLNTILSSLSYQCFPLEHFDTSLSFVDWHPIRKWFKKICYIKRNA